MGKISETLKRNKELILFLNPTATNFKVIVKNSVVGFSYSIGNSNNFSPLIHYAHKNI